MGMTSIWHWMILLALALLFFSLGKIPTLLGYLAGGVKALRKERKGRHGASQADKPNVRDANLIDGPVNPPSPSANSGKWKFVGAVVGGILGAILLGAASLPFLFGLLAVPGFVFGVYYGGKVGSVFDYIEKR